MTASIVLAALLALGGAAANLDAPTWNQDVAAIVHQNCVSCHAPGEIGPMSLRTYEEARPWAKSVAINVKSRTMPPWHADPGYGPFANDRSLTEDEIETLARWAATGARRGEGEAPAPPPPRDTEWTLGEPDWVIEFDPFDVAADGPDQFEVVPIDTGFTEDRWIEAVEVLPGDKEVVHHFLLWMADEAGQNQQTLVGGWAAGAPPVVAPEGTARLVKAGHPLLGDFHYHPNGTATTDRTKVGIHFADPETVEKELVNLWVLNAAFEIPAGDPDYGATSTYTFREDATIYSLTPHMHYRGKDFSFIATYPNGESEELLKVSNYDFNWQTGYDFVEPVKVPAGTRIDCLAHWDNSADNPANPDPTKDVTWGTESTDEMLIGFVDFVVDEGVSPKPVHAVTAQLPSLAQRFPRHVWTIEGQRTPGESEPMAIHLPAEGQGGWYVGFGRTVLPAPIRDVVWEGDRVTAKAYIPGAEEPFVIEGVRLEDGDLEMKLTTPGGTSEMRAVAAEKAGGQTTLPTASTAEAE